MSAKKYNNKLFEYLKNILVTKDYAVFLGHTMDHNFEKDFSKFMVIRYLSMCKDKTVQYLMTQYQKELEVLDNKTVYALLMRMIPVQTSSFIKYIK